MRWEYSRRATRDLTLTYREARPVSKSKKVRAHEVFPRSLRTSSAKPPRHWAPPDTRMRVRTPTRVAASSVCWKAQTHGTGCFVCRREAE